MTSHSDDTATDGNRAAVVGTVATAGDGVGNGAIATVGTVGIANRATVGDGIGNHATVGDGVGNRAAVVGTVGNATTTAVLSSPPMNDGTTTRVAAVQMTSGGDIARNLDAVAGFVGEAAGGGAVVVALPECFALMAGKEKLRDAAEVYGDGKIQNFTADLARENKICIVAGSLPLKSDDADRVFNSSLVFDAAGERVARYDKIHLFDVALPGETHRESDYTAAGERCVTADTAAGAVGLSVCYDLRFPELYRNLAAAGATILSVPSAFTPPTGAAHWSPLLRARAIENCCYVVAPAQVGDHGYRKTHGHSLIIDPWGKVVAERAADTGVVFADLDAARVKKLRASLPCLNHRRDDLFFPQRPHLN